MYEMDEAWNAYFEELDPQKRLKLLHDLPDSNDIAKDFCQTLYNQRYSDPKHPERKVDNWLWKFVYLPGLFRRWKFMRSALRKEILATMKELHLEQPDDLSEAEKTILYMEFRNAARRYLSTCKSDGYARKLLGMKKATDQEKLYRACEDIWLVSRKLADTVGLEENFRLWCDALYAELLDYNPDSQEHYMELEQTIQK